MIALLIATFSVFVLLRIAELLRKKGYIHGEISRKFVHIAVGSFVASWAFFMSTWMIAFMCVAFFAVVLASRYFKLFPAIYNVSRQTWGDLLFPIGIVLCALISKSPYIFAASILHLSLGDGLAAVVGETHGRKNSYKIFGNKKSVAGSLTFLAVSAMIVALLAIVQGSAASNYQLFAIPAILMVLENISWNGFDNIFVPLFCAILLNSWL
jgi:phytol kinase